MMSILRLKHLHEAGVRPRVHGNGFIQLDLDERRRLHIWGHRNIPQQNVCTPIHDHVFGFTSTVLHGRIMNVMYDFEPLDESFARYTVFEPYTRDREDTVMRPTDTFGDIHQAWDTCVYGEGEEYQVSSFEFHETFVSEPTATVIIKDGPTAVQGATAQPRVLIERGRMPDNDFNRYDAMDSWLAWFVIADVLKDKCDL